MAKFSVDGSLYWSTYLGASGSDVGFGITVGINGSCYVIGATSSSDFPTKNAYDSSNNGGDDVFITKFIDSFASQSTNYQITTCGFLGVIIIMPILVLVLRRRRK